MTRRPALARRAEALLGTAVAATAPVAGGDVCVATRLRLANGTSALMKTLAQPPAGFFPAEAAGLRWLAEVDGGVATPEVLAVDEDCLLLAWVEPGRPSEDAAAALGRALATTHAAAPALEGRFGGAADRLADGFIATLPLPGGPEQAWADFFAERRLLPYLRLARDRGAIDDDDAAAVEAVVALLGELVPHEPPARLHGDLWNGNVVWGADGTARVLDPAAHAGHRETDLATLALFGLPHLAALHRGYAEVAPLAEGWEDRTGLHQLFPLLVHACLVGGGYGARAATIARRFT